jgi:rhamnogalacturonyl hydrolase YesR
MTITRIGIYCRQAFFLSAVVTFAACANSPAADGGGQGGSGGSSSASSHGGAGGANSGGANTGGAKTGGSNSGGATNSSGGVTASGGVSNSGGAATSGGSTASGGSAGGATSSGGVAVAGLPSASAVLEAMRRANDWFMGAHPDATADIVTDKTRPSNLWTRAAYYEGLMGLYNVEPDATRKGSYYDYAVAWGESPTHPWLLANTKAGVMSTDANNQACGQTYIDLYKIDPQPIRIQEIKANLDDMVTNGTSNVWWWIDAIQMSMPVFAKMGALQNDTKYFDAMWNLYNDSRTQEGGGLWNRADGLWWRDLHYTPSLPSAGDGGTDGVSAGGMDGASAGGSDASSDSGIDGRMDGPSAGIADGGGDGGSDGGAAVVPDWSTKQTITLAMSQALPAQTQDSYIVAPNGKSIYWSRGNGWVFVALARVLDVLPDNDPHRDTYVADFKAIAKAIVPLQRNDGFWNESLFDPNHCSSIGLAGDDGPETSGTAFFTYGLAWGIRKGLLDAALYGPALQNAWNGLSNIALRFDGLLGYVQSTGALPCTEDPQHPGRLGQTTLANFDDYGVGGFLLAGSEVYQLVNSGTASSTGRYTCNEIIGGSLSGQWFAAGFESIVDDSRWQIIPKSEAYTNVWADPANAFWTTAPTSPCTNGSGNPDRVIFIAFNWTYTSAVPFQFDLENIIANIQAKYPNVKRIDLMTMIRGPNNQTCGQATGEDFVQPFVDEAIANVVAAPHTVQVTAAPKFYVPDCSAFDPKTTPHFTADGNTAMAQIIGSYYATDQ